MIAIWVSEYFILSLIENNEIAQSNSNQLQ